MSAVRSSRVPAEPPLNRTRRYVPSSVRPAAWETELGQRGSRALSELKQRIVRQLTSTWNEQSFAASGALEPSARRSRFGRFGRWARIGG